MWERPCGGAQPHSLSRSRGLFGQDFWERNSVARTEGAVGFLKEKEEGGKDTPADRRVRTKLGAKK